MQFGQYSYLIEYEKGGEGVLYYLVSKPLHTYSSVRPLAAAVGYPLGTLQIRKQVE